MKNLATAQDANLKKRSVAELRQEVIRIRNAIRYHRDQKGDDRCWADDILLYELLPERIGVITRLPSKDIMLQNCTRYKAMRGSGSHSRIQSTSAKSKFDSDLETAGKEFLVGEVLRLRNGIRKHRVKGTAKTLEDDRELYALLPDGVDADFWLPKELLENCEKFWEWKQQHSPEKIHEW